MVVFSCIVNRGTVIRQDVAVKKTIIGDNTDIARAVGVRSLHPILQRFGRALKFMQLAIREAEFLVALSHPNIVKFEGFVEEVSKDMIWLVFPWEENGNLSVFIASRDWEIPERISLVWSLGSSLISLLRNRVPDL